MITKSASWQSYYMCVYPSYGESPL